jgi:hypothetical protein
MSDMVKGGSGSSGASREDDVCEKAKELLEHTEDYWNTKKTVLKNRF